MDLCIKFISAFTIVFRFLKRLKARNNMISIPDELIENILLRMALPPNSLANLRAVCKEWKLLIESPRFIECYHRQAQETNRNQLVSVVSNNRVYTIELDKLVGRSLDIKENRAFKSLFPLAYGSRLMASCNGMLCFTTMDGILLCDPSTRAYHTVPYPPSNRTPRVKCMCYVVYGFGYDRSTYDYKIVRLVWDSAAIKLTSQVDVYSLNKNSWKRLEGYPNDHISAINCSEPPEYCVFVDDALYWLVTGRFDGQEAIENRILRFDLSSEKFSSFPWHGRMVTCYPTGHLDVVDGCLSTWFRQSSDNIEIWIMKKYGMEESRWTKLLTMQNDAAKIKLIALSEDGSRLFLAKYNKALGQDTRFCWYDIDTSTRISEIQMRNLRKEVVFRVETSIQSKLTLPLDKLRNTRELIPLSMNRWHAITI